MSGQIVNPEILNLDGRWIVYHVRFDDKIIRLNMVNIIQQNDTVLFIDQRDTISNGIIIADTIFCDDIYELGIREIYLIKNDYLVSRTPDCEYYKCLIFEGVDNRARMPILSKGHTLQLIDKEQLILFEIENIKDSMLKIPI